MVGRSDVKVDLLITELRTGGAERCLTELAIGLRAAGDEVRVLSLADFPEPSVRDELVQRLTKEQIPTFSFHANRTSHALKAYRGLKEFWKKDPPQVVQTFLFHPNVLGTVVAKTSGIPIRIGGIRVAEPIRWRLWLERRAVQRMQGLVCVSDAVAKFAKTRLRPRGSCLIQVIPNAINLTKARSAVPYRWSQPISQELVVLVVGRLHYQKGTDWLARMAEPLVRQTSAQLVVVGEGPYEKELQATFHRLPPGRSLLLPWTEQVASLIAAARLVLLPSRYEGMPNVVLEAMAAAKPVVATDVEGVRELLGKEGQAQIVPFGDSELCLQLINRLLTDDAFYAQMANCNRARVETGFSIPGMVESYRDFYRRIYELHRSDYRRS